MRPISLPIPSVGHGLPLPAIACELWHGWRGCRVLVTGATGFTGARLVERLCALGAQVVAVHRRDNLPPSLVGKSIE